MRHRRRSIAVAFAALVSLLACSNEPTKPLEHGDPDAALVRDADALFQTDSLAYVVTVDDYGYRGRFGVRFTNRTGRTVYFVNCGGATAFTLEKLIDGKWRSVWSPVMLLCLSPPIEVPAGGGYDMPVHLYAGQPGGRIWPQFEVSDMDGVYRIVWHNALSSYQDRLPFGEQLPLAQRVSNRFTIEVEER